LTSCTGPSATPALAGDTLVLEAMDVTCQRPLVLFTNSDRHVVPDYSMVTSNSD
jgi:hypothetical protein